MGKFLLQRRSFLSVQRVHGSWNENAASSPAIIFIGSAHRWRSLNRKKPCGCMKGEMRHGLSECHDLHAWSWFWQ